MPSTMLRVVAVSLAFASTVAAGNVATLKDSDGLCWSACSDAIGSVTFGDSDPTLDYYPGLVASKDYMTSTVLCMDTYCPATKFSVDGGWELFASYAKQYGDVPSIPTVESVRAEINKSAVVNVDVRDTANLLPMYNSTVLIAQNNFDAGLRTELVWALEMRQHHAYGWTMYLLLGIMLVIGTGNRLFAALSKHVNRGDPEDMHLGAPVRDTLISKVYTWYLRRIAVPATFGYRHMQPWGWLSIPTRIQAILVFIYVALNLIFTCTGYELFVENMYWSSKSIQLWRYVADRTGIMAFYNMPLLWILAGRNDVLIWLTGWSYQSTNVFHRWAARVATVQAIVHSAAYTWLELDYLPSMFAYEYWAMGVFATVVMCMMLPLAIRPFRERMYETFLMLHIMMALATLILLFYHVKIFDGEYDGWLWACVAIWLFDRVLRIVRVLVLSYKTFRSGGRNTVARMTNTSDSGLIRLSVESSIPISPKPGSYYFLYTPRSFAPWENHPFTLASWTKSADGKSTTLHFLMAAQNGATGRLARRIKRVQGGDLNMRVLLEGPYGCKHPVGNYDHVLLIAGGSGVTAVLPYLYALCKEGHRNVSVVWVVKNSQYAADVVANELSPRHTGTANVRLYISQEEGATPDAVVEAIPQMEAQPSHDAVTGAEGAEKNSDGASNSDNGKDLSILRGRPAMKDLVAESIRHLVGGERLAVLGCGPWSMMDDLRLAIAQSYGTGDNQVPGSQLEYFEDAFEW